MINPIFFRFEVNRLQAVVAALSVLSGLFFAAASGGYAIANEKTMWTFSDKVGNGDVSLTFGAPGNEELTEIYFSCSPGTGAVNLHIVESNSKLKPGDTACLALTVGSIQVGACGAATPNELAGVPSLEAIIGINEPIFAALRGNGKLGVHIAGDHSSISLVGADIPAGKFLKACRYRAP